MSEEVRRNGLTGVREIGDKWVALTYEDIDLDTLDAFRVPPMSI